HAGVDAFFWKPPHQMHSITVLCRKWSFSVGALRTEISAEFEMVLV
ncbi:TPA: phage tail protein, partial [Serratia marcescens]|nr:phage tail protein [Serratia marcescens]